jgi:hypothetical protein
MTVLMEVPKCLPARRDQAVCFSDVVRQDMRHYCRNDANIGWMSSKKMNQPCTSFHMRRYLAIRAMHYEDVMPRLSQLRV